MQKKAHMEKKKKELDDAIAKYHDAADQAEELIHSYKVELQRQAEDVKTKSPDAANAAPQGPASPKN